MSQAAQSRTWPLNLFAFSAVYFITASAWDVGFGQLYEAFASNFAALRHVPIEISYLLTPIVLCAILGFALGRWQPFAQSEGAMIAAAISCLVAPFVVFFPVLYFNRFDLGSCIGD